MKYLDNIYIFTHENDCKTIDICQQLQTKYITTDAWYANGASFSKSSGLNSCLTKIQNYNHIDWVLKLDADIYLPSNFRLVPKDLDPSYLYSAKRRMCHTFSDWQKLYHGIYAWSDFKKSIIWLRNGLVWGKRPTNNVAALCGYFQLWNFGYYSFSTNFPYSSTAALYDIDFALQFPENKRIFFEDFEVLHLGESKMNWEGRITKQWEPDK